MARGFKQIIKGVNPEIVADIGDDVLIIRHNQAPVNGASGTLAGEAAPGSYLVDRSGKTGYLNTGTLDSPVWTPIGGAGGGVTVESVNGQTGAVVLDAGDVGALPDTYSAPIDSVNGQTGAVSLGASDVGAASSSHNHDGTYAPVDHGHGISDVSGLQSELDGKAGTGHAHAIGDVSDLQSELDTKLTASQATAQADSAAEDISTLVTDFNTLLSKLRTAGILAT